MKKKKIEDLGQKWVLEVFLHAEDEKSGLHEERGKTKAVQEEGKESKYSTGNRESVSPASAFWTAACWMIGLKSLLI